VNGLRVAVIGALTADLPHLTTPDLVGPWKALPVVETVRRHAKEAQDRADQIVALGHITPDEEDSLLAQAPEVRVVVSGHLHRGLEEAKRRDGRMVVRVRGYGVELGRLDLEVDTDKKSLASSSWKRIPVKAAETPAAPDVAKAVDRWEKKVSKIVDVAIGESRREFSIPEVKTLMERAMAEKTGADFAYMNKGGVRDILPKGRILARHIWNIMPFDNKVVVGTVRGSDLPVVIRNGNSIDPNREYSLAVPDFVAANQQKELGVSGLRFPKVGPLQRDLLIAWVKEKKVLD
jgi:2',3'-cyclic-nucleotide 2'-phosphodiesterase (5'-nucleotidase family)